MSGDQVYPTLLNYTLTEDQVLNTLGFTRGMDMCHYVSLGLFGLFMGLGWLVITCRNRKI